ncbi:DNA polymerase III subunit epsilon [Acinetobacter defluvii]|uniref:Ribonuclease H n=1 Tax=Acinetobacter defluvii TaxID=1871111 RepID=A0A2S2FEQ4_9GAMM|nr:DNA polymerase III subunit epsilon [Acinetobacter defluvii]AWL29424.1 DNA polymerase III subunit epsilon [Acinetobacter defluvii]
MSQTITLYVDGACKGNPGLGGWGAYVITATEEHKLCGGELETTNNRMELSAAIQGIAFCPKDAKLVLWTDSNYVKRGITEWIENWKKKNWKDVKNPDLWKQLDATCKGRDIEWNWIKGHAGHAGNEMADQLANLGAANTAKGIQEPQITTIPKTVTQASEIMNEDKKKVETDWLLDDPFGLDVMENDSSDEFENDMQLENTLGSEIDATSQTASQVIHNDATDENEVSNQISENSVIENATSTSHPHIVITPKKLDLQGPRQLILDTETTGFYFQDSDRIIEIGAIEMINRKLTGSSIHIYINPEKPVGDSEAIHGITDEFLKDKPKYDEIAQVLFDYLKGSEIIAHNASFDMNFLDMEFKRSGFVALSEVCTVTDTLAMAKSKHPGQKNSLDALVRRYEIPQRDRTFHGALLDAEILSDVYLAMTGGQVSFDMDALSNANEFSNCSQSRQTIDLDAPIILASDEELTAHQTWMDEFEKKNGEACIFAK